MASAPLGDAIAYAQYRPPYRFSELLAFFRVRQLAGVELVDEEAYMRAVRLERPGGGIAEGWVRIEDDPTHKRLVVTMSESLAPCVPQVVARVRRMFDVDCDPVAIARGLEALDSIVPGAVREGTRLPGWPGATLSKKQASSGNIGLSVPWYGGPWLPKQLASLGAQVQGIEPRELAWATCSYAEGLSAELQGSPPEG